MLVQVEMRLAVALDIHGHERHQLHEAGIDPASRARHSAIGTRLMRLFSNHDIGFDVASSFTLVGLTRVSIGPAISVMAVRLRRIARFGHQGHGGEHLRRKAGTPPAYGRPAR